MAPRTHALRKGNGTYVPTVADLDRRMSDHEKDDQERHEATNKALGEIGADVKGMATTLTTIVSERQAQELFEKWKQKWLVAALTIAGIVVPIGTAIYDHLAK